MDLLVVFLKTKMSLEGNNNELEAHILIAEPIPMHAI